MIPEQRKSAYQVDEPPQPILFVEEIEHGSEGETDGEEHGGVAAAGGVRALQEPQRVAHHLRQQRMRQHAHLTQPEEADTHNSKTQKSSGCAHRVRTASYPLHSVLVVCEVIEAQGDAGGSHGGPRDLQ